MLKDLKKVSRPSRTKPGLQEFFILILVYSYYNKNAHNVKNEFSIPHSVIADYFGCTCRTVCRWFEKLLDLGYIKYAVRDNAGKTAYYRVRENGEIVRKSYIIPKYKKINVSEGNNIKFLAVYTLDQQGLNQYLSDRVDIDVLGHIDQYKQKFDDFIIFLSNRSKHSEFIESLNLDNIDDIPDQLSADEKKELKRALNIHTKLRENEVYVEKKRKLDEQFPEFKCKYLAEGCLRLTHEICTTVNPEHIEKINEDNYWRSSHARIDMLQNLLQDDIQNIVEYDVNGSIYRLTYNLYHDKILPADTDIYELIWNECNFSIKWTSMNRDKYRKVFKSILMPIYMKPSTINYRASQWEYINKYYAGHPRKYKRLSKDEQLFYETYEIFVTDLGIDIKTFMKVVQQTMHKVLNTSKFIGSDIFTQESNLHILIREKFLQKNIRCVNVYDGFYFIQNQVSEQTFITVYNDALLELKQNLQKGIGTTIP